MVRGVSLGVNRPCARVRAPQRAIAAAVLRHELYVLGQQVLQEGREGEVEGEGAVLSVRVAHSLDLAPLVP